MLAVVSDLHLTDCTTATNPHASAFELLTGELTINAKSKRASEIQVLLLGDIVDLVRTSYWHEKAIPADRRPWGGKLEPATAMNPDPDVERQFLEVLERVLAQASTRALLDGLKELRDRDGRPPKIAYVVGNHDRVLHNFPSLRERIARELAPLEVEFSTFFHSEVYSVAARHGHEWEVTCHGWEFLRKVLDRKSRAGRFDPEAYRVMAIGEAITAELMSGFVHHLQTTLTAPADAPFLRMAGEVNNLRPQTDVIRWITWRLAKAESGRYLQAATEAFRTALEATLGCTLAKRWDELKRDFVVSGDITDHLSKALGLLKGKNGLKRLETLIPI
ncbi:MAG TPA: hypothetical protein VFQ39_13885, partial [Longimicrobium sp.]|nr:hypothetical protein [Longimicrobium sp.]